MGNIIQYRQLFLLTVSLFKEIARQPAVLFWGIIFPILMSLGLGIAFTQKADMVHRIAVIEKHPDSGADGLLGRLFAERGAKAVKSGTDGWTYEIRVRNETLGNSIFKFRKTNRRDAEIQLKRGRISLILEDTADRVQYHFDPLNDASQLTYLKLSELIENRGRNRVTKSEAVIPMTVTGTRYIDFLVPGLIAMGIMMSCMWGMSYGMIEKRSRKLLRRMVATPMRKSYFLMALITVRVVMNAVEGVLLFFFAYLVFHITIQGSLIALAVFFVSANFAFGGIAICVASRTANTEIGNGLVNVVVMPMMVLSGVFFSYHNFPEWSIPFIRKLPLTILADGLRSIFIEGAGMAEIAAPAAILFCIGLFFFVVGLRIFKWH